MAEESKKRQDKLEHYGEQGNEGQYGQGQYTAEGRPDPRGPQGQDIQQELPKIEEMDEQKMDQDVYSRQNDLEQEKIQQDYSSQKQKREGKTRE